MLSRRSKGPNSDRGTPGAGICGILPGGLFMQRLGCPVFWLDHKVHASSVMAGAFVATDGILIRRVIGEVNSKGRFRRPSGGARRLKNAPEGCARTECPIALSPNRTVLRAAITHRSASEPYIRLNDRHPTSRPRVATIHPILGGCIALQSCELDHRLPVHRL